MHHNATPTQAFIISHLDIASFSICPLSHKLILHTYWVNPEGAQAGKMGLSLVIVMFVGASGSKIRLRRLHLKY